MDLKQALLNAQEDRQAAVEERSRLDATIADLDAEILGLSLAVTRHDGLSDTDALVTEMLTDWINLARTDAVVAALNEVGRPVGPAHITEMLHQKGRSDERDHVAASMAYLKNQNRVHSVGYGKWVPGPEPDENLGLGLGKLEIGSAEELGRRGAS